MVLALFAVVSCCFFSFADVVVVVAVAVVAVIAIVILVSVRETSSDMWWVRTGTNFVLPLTGMGSVSGLVVHYGLATSHSAGK